MKSVLETKNGGNSTKDLVFLSGNLINYFPSKDVNPLTFTYIGSSI